MTTLTPEETKTVLEACPRCMGACKIVHDTNADYERHWDYYILCTNAECELEGGRFKTREAAVDWWNTRAQRPATPAPAGWVMVPCEIHKDDTPYRTDFTTYLSIHNGVQWYNYPLGDFKAPAAPAVSNPEPITDTAKRRAMMYVDSLIDDNANPCNELKTIKKMLSNPDGWKTMESAPKKTPVLLKFKDDLSQHYGTFADRMKGWEGLCFVGQSFYDDHELMGWSFAAPVGTGGFPDAWMEGWRLLPLPPTPAETVKPEISRAEKIARGHALLATAETRKGQSPYEAGYDAGENEATICNCNFSFFTTPERTKEWERGYADAKRKTP